MTRVIYLLLLVVVAIGQLAAGIKEAADGCGPCRKEECVEPVSCRAGIVPDHCHCCSVCARLEGERCDNGTLALPASWSSERYGTCGSNMLCLLRNDDLDDSVDIEFFL